MITHFPTTLLFCAVTFSFMQDTHSSDDMSSGTDSPPRLTQNLSRADRQRRTEINAVKREFQEITEAKNTQALIGLLESPKGQLLEKETLFKKAKFLAASGTPISIQMLRIILSPATSSGLIPSDITFSNTDKLTIFRSALMGAHFGLCGYILDNLSVTEAHEITSIADTIGAYLVNVCEAGHLAAVEYLLDETPIDYRPSYFMRKQALSTTCYTHHFPVAEYFFSLSNDNALREPDLLEALAIVDERVAQYNFNLTSTPYLKQVLDNYRRNPTETIRISAEIHQYATTPIFEDGLRYTLNDRVLQCLSIANQGEFETPDAVDETLLNLIAQTVTSDAEQERLHFMLYEGWNDMTSFRLGTVLRYLKTAHADNPTAINLWFSGYADESRYAFKESIGEEESCKKGIDERIITGLRNIDDAMLAPYFIQGNQDWLLSNFFAQRNIGTDTGCALLCRDLCTTRDQFADDVIGNIRAAITYNIRRFCDDHQIILTPHLEKRIEEEAQFATDYADMYLPKLDQLLRNIRWREERDAQDREYAQCLEEEHLATERKAQALMLKEQRAQQGAEAGATAHLAPAHLTPAQLRAQRAEYFKNLAASKSDTSK